MHVYLGDKGKKRSLDGSERKCNKKQKGMCCVRVYIDFIKTSVFSNNFINTYVFLIQICFFLNTCI